MGTKSLSSALGNCPDPILFIPKYRRKTFFQGVRKEVGEILRTLCEYEEVEWGNGSISADPVHRYVCMAAKLSVSVFMNG